MAKNFKIGTRGSPLALAQATIVRQMLIDRQLVEADAIETIVISTSGDRIQDRSLADIGGKGLFTKEIEEALLDGRIDVAVHSLKDLPAWMPDGLGLAAVLPRADPRDALLSPVADRIGSLPHGAKVGTSSPRRRALLLSLRPDLDIVEFRGNLGTRLAKLDSGEVDATLLAVAGMGRLGLSAPHHPIETSEMLPAACQGAIGLEIRLDDARAQSICDVLTDRPTAVAVSAERAFLAALDGSCRTPVAALAIFDGATVTLDGLVARMDGTAIVRVREQSSAADAVNMGDAAGRAVKADLPPDFFAAAGLL